VSFRFKLDYRKFPAQPTEPFPRRTSVSRPVIPIALINNQRRVRYLTLIDSGADYCIFHAEIGEQIGLQIESGKRLSFSGSSGQEQSAYFHEIKLEVGGHEISCFAGFSRELQSLPYGILGQEGFFDNFKITFDYQKDKIELQSVTD
jgi:hypothetical protein